MTTPQYARIKDYLRERIARGDLKPGDRVPSENQLASEFEVSRMTARRALLELADAGMLLRSQGLGSFVADARPIGSITQIRDIAEEIAQRGHRHHLQILALGPLQASASAAAQLALTEGAAIFQSVVVHCENDIPVQYESRLVNPHMAPDYLQQTFSTMTPSAYLTAVAPLTEADQSVEAILPDAEVAGHLQIKAAAPCLRISRRTFADRGVVSLAELVHPGDRYRLGSHLDF